MPLAIELVVERAPEQIRCGGLALERRLGRRRAPGRWCERTEDDADVAPAALPVDRGRDRRGHHREIPLPEAELFERGAPCDGRLGDADTEDELVRFEDGLPRPRIEGGDR